MRNRMTRGVPERIDTVHFGRMPATPFWAVAMACFLLPGACAARSARAQAAPAQSPADAPAANTPTTVADQEGGMSPVRRQQMDDSVMEPRKIAAAIVGADFPPPRTIVQVGAFQGEFLEVFLDAFPTAHGQWTEAITSEHNFPATKERFARFGDRISFRWGCARRDLSRPGCVMPPNTDVILVEWLSIQQTLDGVVREYKAAADKLHSGGWIVNLDHVTFSDPGWDALVQIGAKGIRDTKVEGPPVHYPQFRVPTVEEQLAAMRSAGFEAHVVWQSFSTVLFIGRKK